MRPKDGFEYNDETYLVLVSYGFTIWRWGMNFVYLAAFQHWVSTDYWFTLKMLGPVLLIAVEKTFFCVP